MQLGLTTSVTLADLENIEQGRTTQREILQLLSNWFHPHFL